MITRPLHFLLIAICVAVLTSSTFANTNYNVLFIAVDDLRPELKCYGASHMVTPNIDRLANSGRLFRRHYVAVPTCGASRYAMLTGKRPTSAADTDNAAFDQLPTFEGSTPESFAHLFRRNGWRTVSMGKVSHEPDGYVWNNSSALGGDDRGRTSVARAEMPFSWDEILFGQDKWGARSNPLFNYANGVTRVSGTSPAYEIGTNRVDEDYLDGQIARGAVAKLQEFKQDGTRFLMAVGFFRPHLPFSAPKSYWDLYDPENLPAPFPAVPPTNALAGTTTQSSEINNYNHGYHPGDPVTHTDDNYRKKLRRGYYASVSYVDAQIGKVLDALEELGLSENTVVVLWGDHGWCLDDYNVLAKHNVLERGVHSPLIIRTPAMKFPGRASDGIVETLDIYPTLARLCGLTPPAAIHGTSLIPLLNNPDAPGKGWAYSRQINTLNQDSVRTDRWRLIRVGNAYDLYDFQASPYEVNDVSNIFTNEVNDIVTNKLNIQSIRTGTMNYLSWKAAHFSGAELSNTNISGLQADPDSDGVPNILECLGGTNPKNPAQAARLIGDVQQLSVAGVTNEYFTSRFEASSLVDDIAFALDGSADLQSWSASSVAYVTNTSLGNGVYEYLFRTTNTVGSEPGRFVRLWAEQTR